ncbi:MAG: glycosyltransferase, partial [Pseudomonadota bacterium]
KKALEKKLAAAADVEQNFKKADSALKRERAKSTKLRAENKRVQTLLEEQRDAVSTSEKKLRAMKIRLKSAEQAVDEFSRMLEVDEATTKQQIEVLQAQLASDRVAYKELSDRADIVYAETQQWRKKPLRTWARIHAPLNLGLGRRFRTLKRSTVENARYLAIKTGVLVYRLLPLSTPQKLALRSRLINRFGPMLGYTPRVDLMPAPSGTFELERVSDRVVSLARASTGAPANLPPRSVSIIVPVYNQIEYTLQCIDTVHANTDVDYELIVVDDCSSDDTLAKLKGRTDITYIRNTKNLGFIGSCNVGAARATKQYVCYLNNDTEAAEHWASTLIDTFELHTNVGMVGSKLIYPDGRLQEAGGIIWNDFSGWNYGRLQDRTHPQFNHARHADYCSGAAILLPRALNQALGGFDPTFTPAYGEDSDLAFRIRALGLSVLYQPLSNVIHHEGITSGTDTTKGVKAYQVVNAKKLKERWSPVLTHFGVNGVDVDQATRRGTIGKVLVLDQITPEPDRDAGSITALELMRGLRDFGYDVTFAPCSNYTFIPHYTELLSAMGIESLLYPWCKSLDEHLKALEEPYDCIVIFRVNTFEDNFDALKNHASGSKIIYHTSDLHFLREERSQQLETAKDHQKDGGQTETKVKELRLISASDLTIVHSYFEQELLSQLVPDVKVKVFPWVYEPRGPGADFDERDMSAVFLGGYRHQPNVDAVDHYVADIAPHVRDIFGDETVVLKAIGSHPPEHFNAYRGDDVDIVGFVEDLEPVLTEAKMMVVPLRYGAGLKGKIITAMAHGLPVVSTTVGVEGMALTDGHDVLVADTPEEFAAAMKRLHDDEDLWRTLRDNALAF